MIFVGFTGTRHGMTEAQQATFREVFPTDAGAFHHGSCQGADVQAARLVRQLRPDGITSICHPGPDGDTHREASGVDDFTHTGKTHFARNRDIVDACPVLIACPCDMTEQPRGGTWYTINYARKCERRILIIWPDGSVKLETP